VHQQGGQMSEICWFLHTFVNSMKIHVYPFNPNDIPLNGIYFFLESGEIAHGVKRIVRVGTHTGPNNLRNRLAEHYTGGNKDRSIFRKNIGRGLLNKDKDPFLKFWELDLTGREARKKYEGIIDREKQASVERQVTDYIQKNISFVVVEIPDEDKRLLLEGLSISIIFQCQECKPSPGWLGLHSPSPKIQGGGLWNINGLGGSRDSGGRDPGGRDSGGFSSVMAPLKPPPKGKPPRQAGVREEDARLANDPPPPIVRATSLSLEEEDS
jgi:hypothetical protein